MEEENKNDRAKYFINPLLEQALTVTEGQNDGEFFPHPLTSA
jgi:hypothetical protein